MSEERYRHKKRGSTYTVIARGFFQVDGDLDNEKVVVYRGKDGRVWVRPEYEFNDGRFERMPDTKRETFEVPEGCEAVRDADGRATGEVRKASDWTVDDTKVARRILSVLGIGDEASLDPGIDWRRDRIAEIVRLHVDEALKVDPTTTANLRGDE